RTNAKEKWGPEPAISGDHELATCGDFYMATDRQRLAVTGKGRLAWYRQPLGFPQHAALTGALLQWIERSQD
ncbi:hypothetical protein, partial [Nonomuraea wenchangensis]|uniref:hypothetical protein n=1 Tax=Nonomuraea wenchangensis TaxID=568860 RepID=UPI00331E66F4